MAFNSTFSFGREPVSVIEPAFAAKGSGPAPASTDDPNVGDGYADTFILHPSGNNTIGGFDAGEGDTLILVSDELDLGDITWTISNNGALATWPGGSVLLLGVTEAPDNDDDWFQIGDPDDYREPEDPSIGFASESDDTEGDGGADTIVLHSEGTDTVFGFDAEEGDTLVLVSDELTLDDVSWEVTADGVTGSWDGGGVILMGVTEAPGEDDSWFKIGSTEEYPEHEEPMPQLAETKADAEASTDDPNIGDGYADTLVIQAGGNSTIGGFDAGEGDTLVLVSGELEEGDITWTVTDDGLQGSWDGGSVLLLEVTEAPGEDDDWFLIGDPEDYREPGDPTVNSESEDDGLALELTMQEQDSAPAEAPAAVDIASLLNDLDLGFTGLPGFDLGLFDF